MIYQSFSRRQLLTLTWWRRNEFAGYDGILCDGSVRSGKTLSMAVGFLLWSMERFDGGQFALCGKTVESLRRNVANLLPQWLEGVFQLEERRSENRITVTGVGHRNNYYLFGGKDESSYAQIQGMTLCGVLLDEVALMPRSFVEQALARCSVPGSKFWFNCNPEGPEHWFYLEWVRQARARNILYLHFTMEDNPSLSPEIRERYERLYNGVFYDRYVRGLWVAAEGLVYDGFDPARHMPPTLPETAGRCYVSVDYGTRNPTVFLLWQKEKGATAGAACGNTTGTGGSGSSKRQTEHMRRICSIFYPANIPQMVIVDPSAASFITELRQLGLPVQQADNAVLDGIRCVSDLLREGQLLFHPDCAHTKSEFRAYVWDEDAAAQGVDRPVKDHDHCMDAVRYFAYTVVRRGTARVGRRPRGL
ncbi:MAG: PBSX family phage terminase large subunit [Clostridiales bacterium]|nr:PBSX family phage terminase large subunit [Clostridiales bacterium]